MSYFYIQLKISLFCLTLSTLGEMFFNKKHSFFEEEQLAKKNQYLIKQLRRWKF